MEHLKYMHNFYELPGFGWGGLEGKVIIYKPTLVKQMSGKKTNKKKKKSSVKLHGRISRYIIMIIILL